MRDTGKITLNPATAALLGDIGRVLVRQGKLFVSVTENNYHWSPDHVHLFSPGRVINVVGRWLSIVSMYVREHIIFLRAQASGQ